MSEGCNVKPHKQKSVKQPHLPFKCGDRVMAFDDDGGTVLGTVKWIGGGSRHNLVGIETVSTFI